MNLIFALLYLVLFSLLIYLYVLFFKWLWRVGTFIRTKLHNRKLKKQGNQPDPTSRSEYFKNGWFVFKDKRKNIVLLIALLAVNLLVFSQRFQQYTTAENKHHDAKVFFAVGETISSFKMASLTFLHPDFPLFWPVEWLQRLVYLHGSSLLPENDDEKYLWQQLWFYNPYTVTLTPPWGTRAKPYTPMYNSKHFSKIYNEYMIVLEKVMDGNIADKKLFYEVVPRDITNNLEFAVIFQMYHDGLRWTGEAGIRIAKEPKYQKQTDNLYRYSTLTEQWWGDGTIPEKIRMIPQQRLTFLEARMAITENVMFRKLLLEPTKCDDPIIHSYFRQRQRIFDETPIEYFDRFSMTLNNDQSRFYNYLFSKYCGLELPVAPKKVNGHQFSRFQYKDEQERNLRKGIGYDLQDHEENKMIQSVFVALLEKNTQKVIEALAQNDLGPDLRFYGKKTPMHYAAHNNDVKTMDALLKRGANINAEDKAGKTPFQYAIENFNYEASQFLLEHNATHQWVAEIMDSTDVRNSIEISTTTAWDYIMGFGASKIHRVRTDEEREKIVKIVKLLINYRVAFQMTRNYCQETWLQTAVKGIGIQNSPDVSDKEAIVKMLLEAGADFRVKDCEGRNVFDEAVLNHSRIEGVFYPYMTKEERTYYKIRQ